MKIVDTQKMGHERYKMPRKTEKTSSNKQYFDTVRRASNIQTVKQN